MKSKIGIILNCIGTILSLYGFLSTDKNMVGTWGEIAQRKETYNKECPFVFLGIALIIIGTILQVIP